MVFFQNVFFSYNLTNLSFQWLKEIALGRVWLLFEGDLENQTVCQINSRIRASLQVLIIESHESIKVSMNLDIHT